MINTTPVPVGTSNLLMKSQSASGRNFETLPSIVVEYFKLDDIKAYKAEDYKVTVTFNSKFYCLIYTYVHDEVKNKTKTVGPKGIQVEKLVVLE